MASEGFSKSGALLKLKAPVELLMLNLEASSPPFNDQVTVSFAAKVWTVVWFSLIDKGKENEVINLARKSLEIE